MPSISTSATVWAFHRFPTDDAMAIHAHATVQEISVPSVDTTTGLQTTSTADTTAATGRRMVRPTL